ncbi:hypothetical protein GCM10023156_39610 [Novipirellula rosea]|uniref:Uncharacterized protein n=1 Tax=Novipirellula rosea TaxID=1031540 RepID=A0ABP8N1I9_9BACT
MTDLHDIHVADWKWLEDERVGRETGRQGDRETARQGDRETGRHGDTETRRHGDTETRS